MAEVLFREKRAAPLFSNCGACASIEMGDEARRLKGVLGRYEECSREWMKNKAGSDAAIHCASREVRLWPIGGKQA